MKVKLDRGTGVILHDCGTATYCSAADCDMFGDVLSHLSLESRAANPQNGGWDSAH